MISCGVQDAPDAENSDDIGFSAEDLGDMVADALALYDKDYECIHFYCGDNAYVNVALARKTEEWLLRNKGIERTVPLVGCASHRLNLAVQKFYGPESEYQELIDAVVNIMVDLRTQK